MSQYHTINAGETERFFTVVARADGSPITAGPVNYYLRAKSGANDTKYWRDSDETWQAVKTANAMTHDDDGHWEIDLTSSPFADGIRYHEYVMESGDLHVPQGRHLVGLTANAVDVDTIKTQAVVCAAGVTVLPSVGAATIQPTNVQLNARTILAASYFDPAIDTVNTVTNLTNLPACPTDWLTAAGLSAAAVAKIEAALINEGDGQQLIDAIVQAIDAADIENDVLPALIRDAILNRVLSGNHDIAGTVGKVLQDTLADTNELQVNQGNWLTATGFATSIELAKVPKSDGTATWNATALASINTECDSAISDYDGPTYAEMEARTLVAASYATATNLAVVDALLDKFAPAIIGTLTQAGTNTEIYVYGGVTLTLTSDSSGNRSAVVFT